MKEIINIDSNLFKELTKIAQMSSCHRSKCGSIIIKENYLGGSIYYCKECQPL